MSGIAKSVTGFFNNPGKAISHFAGELPRDLMQGLQFAPMLAGVGGPIGRFLSPMMGGLGKAMPYINMLGGGLGGGYGGPFGNNHFGSFGGGGYPGGTPIMIGDSGMNDAALRELGLANSSFGRLGSLADAVGGFTGATGKPGELTPWEQTTLNSLLGGVTGAERSDIAQQDENASARGLGRASSNQANQGNMRALYSGQKMDLLNQMFNQDAARRMAGFNMMGDLYGRMGQGQFGIGAEMGGPFAANQLRMASENASTMGAMNGYMQGQQYFNPMWQYMNQNFGGYSPYLTPRNGSGGPFPNGGFNPWGLPGITGQGWGGGNINWTGPNTFETGRFDGRTPDTFVPKMPTNWWGQPAAAPNIDLNKVD